MIEDREELTKLNTDLTGLSSKIVSVLLVVRSLQLSKHRCRGLPRGASISSIFPKLSAEFSHEMKILHWCKIVCESSVHRSVEKSWGRCMHRAMHPLSFLTASPSRAAGSWCLSPAVIGQEAGHTLDRSPVYHRAHQERLCFAEPQYCWSVLHKTNFI